jgi:hypothetical protein
MFEVDTGQIFWSCDHFSKIAEDPSLNGLKEIVLIHVTRQVIQALTSGFNSFYIATKREEGI